MSSSGHLILVGRIIGYTPSVAFEVTAHLGTLVAVIVAYRSTLKKAFLRPFEKPAPVIVLSTFVTAALVFVFEKPLRATFGGELLPLTFFITAVILALPSLVKRKGIESIGYFEGFVIGVSQAVAVIPGLSRSGVTVSAARLLGADESESADFSFLLSVPIIIVSAASELLRHFDEFLRENYLCLFVVFAAAAICGYLSIKLVLSSIRRGGLTGYSAYLFMLSVLLAANDLVFKVI